MVAVVVAAPAVVTLYPCLKLGNLQKFMFVLLFCFSLQVIFSLFFFVNMRDLGCGFERVFFFLIGL